MANFKLDLHNCLVCAQVKSQFKSINNYDRASHGITLIAFPLST